MKFFFRIAKTQKKNPVLLQITWQSDTVDSNQKTILFIWQHVPFYISTYLQQRIMQY